MIKDVEDLLESVRTYVKANLNTKITAINTEKDDDYSIDTITADNEHFIFGAELLDLPNHAFVNFSISEIQPNQKGGNLALEPSIMIEVCFDNPKAPGTMYKSLRYMRALYETLVDYEDSTDEVSGLEATILKPLLVSLTGRELIISGASFSCGIST